MPFKLFSALHEGKGTENFSAFSEKKIDGATLYLAILLPFRGESAKTLHTGLLGLLENELGKVFTDADDLEAKFESALKRANEFLGEGLGERAEEVLRKGALLVGLMHDEELLVSSYGQGEIFLFRERSLIEVSDGLSPNRPGEEFFQNISSGELQSGDKLLISTFRLQRFVTERQLGHFLEDGVTEAMESISSAIEASEAGSLYILNVKAVETLPFPEAETTKARALPFKTPQLAGALKPLQSTFKKAEHLPLPSKKTALLLGSAVAGFLLIFAIVSVLSGGSEKQTNSQYQDFVSSVEGEFKNVDTRLLEGKPDQANLILDRIEEQAEKMLTDRVDVTNAQEILRIANEKREVINKIMRIKNPTIMADLSGAKDGVVARGLFFMNNELFAFDANDLFRVLLSGSQPEKAGTVTGTDEITLGTPLTAKDEMIFYTKSGTVVEWSDGQARSATTADDTWQPASAIAAFSKFLYLLDPAADQIWKYERRDSGFTMPEGWVADGTDISKGVDFVIDGSVFVLTSEGEIIKFHRGAKADYALKGLPDGKLTGDRIYTDEALSQIFVLDRAQKRISILNKADSEAVYDKQVILENTEPIVDLFAREGRLFVLGEQKIYEIKL